MNDKDARLVKDLRSRAEAWRIADGVPAEVRDAVFVALDEMANAITLVNRSDTEDYEKIWWCKSHHREATSVDKNGRRMCDTKLGGIMLPCRVVLATYHEQQGPV